jgi:hypothetical protein
MRLHMTRDLTVVALGVLLGILLMASVGAFLLFVPALPWAAVITILVALALMFTLGLQTGSRTIWSRR